MNKTLIFFCLSTGILALSIIVACISPVFNNIKVSEYNWSISSWRSLNCKFFEDQQNDENVKLDDIQKYKKLNILCKAKKAMHSLEFASLFINLVLGFFCSNLSLLHFLEVGKDFEKKTGIIGFASGIIGFIITLIYICFSGYIFNNDVAYVNYNSNSNYVGRIQKLYPNGALYKCETDCNIPVYENDKSDFSSFAKYKDLGDKQYNYNSEYYKAHGSTSLCKGSGYPSDCEYVFPTTITTSIVNKDLYDRWITTLILSVFIVACNISLLIFGYLIFKGGENSNEPKTVEIQ